MPLSSSPPHPLPLPCLPAGRRKGRGDSWGLPSLARGEGIVGDYPPSQGERG